MNAKKARLTSKDILEKDFKTAMRGYNQDEVDEFLDIIIQDYEIFQQEIARLEQEIERLKRNSAEQKTRVRPPQQPQPTQVNYDVLKRLSNLEKAVFGKKFADE
ncbi:cell cycle protein GpsB [Compostibacillus humi]|uniref:Cell cycle protein GpsB n=1 Tax=Compostibacillus humi TaxID=1245525 RepID=A0A8J2XE70_9BACI|nr:cell division regulator GpsB [Compostibacillus humi]GFZ76469.1 cell cycle protein GpsB [Compostibacillus humi]HLT54854.1 cell division regulator GpsB [Bacillota bacterium]